MQCLLSARFTMEADVLRNVALGEDAVDLGDEGQWREQQDPITGEIVREWKPLENSDTDSSVVSIDCIVRGIVDGGIRVAGTTERFGKEYENVDFVKMSFGPNFILTKRDRITNIRDKRTKQIIWREEELDAVNGVYRSTVFNVNGVTPEVDPFGRLTSQFALLSRARNS